MNNLRKLSVDDHFYWLIILVLILPVIYDNQWNDFLVVFKQMVSTW